jgi:type VI protein secretion system component VasF
VSAVVHPVPPDFQGTQEEMCRHVERYPPWVLALVVPAWAATAYAGTWVSGRIGNRTCALCIGLLLTAAVVFNVSMLPYPMWFKIVIVLAVPAASWWGSRLSIRRKAIGSNELK